jgi:hypothetical protein
VRSSGRVLFAAIPALVFFFAVSWAAAQEPPQPLPQSPDAPTAPSSTGSSSSKSPNKKYSHADDFLILGTVFTDKGYAFPGIEIRVRRAAEKKFRWDTYANSRGEFAVRVPKGADYEMLVRAKGFLDQTKPLDAKSGLSEARLVFRMEPAKESKK